MSFTSSDFLIFFALVFALYWLARAVRWQNLLLLAASYVFYGWLHPWYAIMLGLSTLADFFLARRLAAEPGRKRLWLATSLLVNLGVLAFFKYHGFYAPAVLSLLASVGLNADPLLVSIALPAGLSFYTLKKLSYIFDVASGTLKPTHSPVDFALYVSFFPQIIAGPIDRPQNLLPQIERGRAWRPELFFNAWPLIVTGFFKKIVVADSIKVMVDQVSASTGPRGCYCWPDRWGSHSKSWPTSRPIRTWRAVLPCCLVSIHRRISASPIFR